MTLSCVILSNTVDNESYAITINCINSLSSTLFNEFSFEIILVESNLTYNSRKFKYPNNIKLILPSEQDFNFHRNLNHGLRNATGDFIAFCNNDLIFYKDWFLQIYTVALDNKFMAFSPVDPTENKLPETTLADLKFIEGYQIQKYFKGWCFVVKKEAFNKTGPFDERFNFYFADNDFCMTLKKYHIRHAVVLHSYVQHLHKSTQVTYKKNIPELLAALTIEKSKLPSYVIKERRYWLLTNDKMVEGLIQFHKKWGNYTTLKAKEKMANWAVKLKLPFLKKYIYTSSNT